MYRVLIVDDEPWVLKGIRSTFKWEQMGFKVIADTTDSLEALVMIERDHPDVVMTDIRMPELTGIELMKRSRDLGIKSEFVIISGAADFHYAQDSIRLGCFDYLLKPLEFEEADKLLERLYHHLQDSNPGKGEEDTASATIDRDMLNNEKFKELLEYVNGHYEEDLHLKDLSHKYYINYTYCCDLFQKSMKSTFTDYVTRLRLSKAKQLLSENKLSIWEVSQHVGYKDYNYFSKVFKKWYGVTPSGFRKNKVGFHGEGR
ncbi:response regulator [Paenibacillus sp. NPDC056579]|uniref:response regulator transcription factor n=1 Tax=unclassified Paenibacillus TaxID=185978 RepID=UPI001EF87EF6|nr:response regulator [Paenibacillus sp. H1-7]ULL16686.1 response regulator [Paenibacillus sp. H1-7]